MAFWGKGAESLIFPRPPHLQIVCNLKSGATNPKVIESIPRAFVRQHDALHAKVYIGDDTAIICSANASANGLGFEGREQDLWWSSHRRSQASSYSLNSSPLTPVVRTAI